MAKEWVLSIRNQCFAANVPFFFKQWGGTRKGEAGRTLDGRTYDEFPQLMQARVLGRKERQALLSAIDTL
jgi:protein gp37